MLLIDCPYCGPRAEIEFHCGGEAHIERPVDPDQQDDKAWADFLFARKNPKGRHHERWFHSHGCQRWFHATRNTVTDDIIAVYPIDEQPPSTDAEEA